MREGCSLKQTNKKSRLELTQLLHLRSNKTVSCMPSKANFEIQEMFHSHQTPQFQLF